MMGAVANPRRMLCLAGIFGLLLCSPLALAASRQLTVAAASDLQPLLNELKPEFERSSGIELTLVYGSSGNLLVQIQNGAPYDVFMSADMGYPQQLVKARLADPKTLYRYALGRLVLWTPPGSPLDLNKLGLQAVLDPAVTKIAIANPRHAPYGRAAVETLKAARLYDKVRSKLVLGENARQAAQFVQSGNAQLGLVPLSLVLAFNRGAYAEIAPEVRASVEQGMVVLSSCRDKDSAEQFVQYMKQTRALMLLKKHGYTTPISLLTKDDPR
jgi:molybdate transport system substrate-binding protein